MFLSSCSNLHHRISSVFKAALPEGPELHQHLMMVCRLVFSLQRFYRLSESFNYITLPYIYFWKALSLFWEEFCSTVLSVCSQRAQLSLKGNGCTKALILLCFFLHYDDASLLLHNRDIAGNHIEKIQSVLYSCLYVLSFDILLNMVSWNFFQGQLLSWALTMKDTVKYLTNLASRVGKGLLCCCLTFEDDR